jgi:hypothetical protein
LIFDFINKNPPVRMRAYPVIVLEMGTRHGHQVNRPSALTNQTGQSRNIRVSSASLSTLKAPSKETIEMATYPELKASHETGTLCSQLRSQEDTLYILILVCEGVFVWETKTGYLLYK